MFLPKSYSWTTQYLPQTPCGWSKELWPLILQWSLQTWCPKQAKQIARLKPLCRNSSDCRYEMAASMGQIWVPKLWDGWCVLKTANPSAKHWFIAQWHDTQPWPGFKTVAIEPGQVEPQFGWSFCRIKLGHLEPNRFEQSGAVLKWGRPQIIHAILRFSITIHPASLGYRNTQVQIQFLLELWGSHWSSQGLLKAFLPGPKALWSHIIFSFWAWSWMIT